MAEHIRTVRARLISYIREHEGASGAQEDATA